jgi:hypothetical protein
MNLGQLEFAVAVASHLKAFERHLQKAVPGVVSHDWLNIKIIHREKFAVILP